MESVLILGTGRLAFHLGHALYRSGVVLAGVAGRDLARTRELAREWDCTGFPLNGPLPEAGLRVLAVSDDAIVHLAALLQADGTPVVHLSGTNPMDLLRPHVHRGVLWPVQSFSPGVPMDFTEVPLVVDATDEPTLQLLGGIAGRLSRTVVRLPFEQRQQLHVSAVVASNFPVFLLREAERLLVKHGIDPQLVLPLWKASTHKAMDGADRSVTGPARRGDRGTVERHLQLLADEPELRRAYAALSDLILHTYHPPAP
ncbi:MAG: DUF2520 domain-containing protein [Flavobacteriales bacterium]|nr:DUF2520 domain-containing protein [Flavobacteriales bacterium]MBP9079787.1 DUF2520 domain-containing protein [Flavobacteriales bacterium]